MQRPADLVLVNARVITLDPRQPSAEAVAARSGKIIGVGVLDKLRGLIGPATQVVDAEGAIAVPSFHDAHMHLLSYARSTSRLDCRRMRSIGEICAALAGRARGRAAGTWLRAFGYDEAVLADGRHPDRYDLDAVAPHHPVRLQHRGLHLDVLNTPALRFTGLMDLSGPEVERDPRTGEATGRLYHAAHLLAGRLPRPADEDLRRDVRRASQQLLAWGVTSIQDASVTNGPEEWETFHRLSRSADLQVRVFLLPGAAHWSEIPAERPSGTMVRLGPVKFMLNEGFVDPSTVCSAVARVRAAGHAVALHAVSEAEIAVALGALRAGSRISSAAPDRIEHGAVIPDEWLDDLRAARVSIVGQPALIYERGDAYHATYPPAQHGWLHRARSLVAAGIPYAAGSDAPVTDPVPGLGLFAARRRSSAGGVTLEPDEALGRLDALAAFTLGPARAVGAEQELGQLRPGAVADITVVDDELLEGTSSRDAYRPARLTIMQGRVAWVRGSGVGGCEEGEYPQDEQDRGVRRRMAQ